MKAVKKTPLGVIPSRETLKIPELNVLMEGKPTTVTPEQKTVSLENLQHFSEIFFPLKKVL